MSGRLRSRLERLERQAPSGLVPLPPLFWEGISGAVPLDQLPPETRQMVAALFDGGRDEPDLIEARITALERLAPG
jgi:hypothetical protein